MLTEDHLDDNAQSSPKTELAGDLVSKRTEDTEELDTLRTSRSDFLKEPVGIGLAWTIMRHFFAGSNVVIGDLQIERLPNFVQSGLLKACNNSMRTVILYVSWLKGRTASGKA